MDIYYTHLYHDCMVTGRKINYDNKNLIHSQFQCSIGHNLMKYVLIKFKNTHFPIHEKEHTNNKNIKRDFSFLLNDLFLIIGADQA